MSHYNLIHMSYMYILMVSEYTSRTQPLAHVHYVNQHIKYVRTSDKKYRFGVPFKVLTNIAKLDCTYKVW